MAGERDVLAEALHDIHSWNAATERAEADAILTALAARGYTLSRSEPDYDAMSVTYRQGWEAGHKAGLQDAATPPEPLPLDVERPPDLYAAIQVVRAYLGIATPEQIIQEEAARLAALREPDRPT